MLSIYFFVGWLKLMSLLLFVFLSFHQLKIVYAYWFFKMAVELLLKDKILLKKIRCYKTKPNHRWPISHYHVSWRMWWKVDCLRFVILIFLNYITELPRKRTITRLSTIAPLVFIQYKKFGLLTNILGTSVLMEQEPSIGPEIVQIVPLVWTKMTP